MARTRATLTCSVDPHDRLTARPGVKDLTCFVIRATHDNMNDPASSHYVSVHLNETDARTLFNVLGKWLHKFKGDQ